VYLPSLCVVQTPLQADSLRHSQTSVTLNTNNQHYDVSKPDTSQSVHYFQLLPAISLMASPLLKPHDILCHFWHWHISDWLHHCQAQQILDIAYYCSLQLTHTQMISHMTNDDWSVQWWSTGRQMYYWLHYQVYFQRNYYRKVSVHFGKHSGIIRVLKCPMTATPQCGAGMYYTPHTHAAWVK